MAKIALIDTMQRTKRDRCILPCALHVTVASAYMILRNRALKSSTAAGLPADLDMMKKVRKVMMRIGGS